MEPARPLKEAFAAMYGDGAQPWVCRAPGRVNIIGEHTDYNGLPVLPMTIDRDIRIAFRPRQDAMIRMRDTDAAFPPTEFANAPSIEPSPSGSWDNYCKAAVVGLNEHFGWHPQTEFGGGTARGMDMLVTGSIPISAGLSSSSALVVACALAYLRCLGKTLDGGTPKLGLGVAPGMEDKPSRCRVSRLELAALLADAERYVGTKGGGMDQAIILLGGEDTACKIDFFPLRIEQVPLLSGHAFVVCNSLVKAEKTGDALHRYNAGPRLCQLICAMVAHQVREEFGDEVVIERLGDLWTGHLCLTDAEVRDLFAKVFPKDTTTLLEAARALRITPDEIRRRWLGDLLEPPQGFSLKARARHQITEYQRVEAARDALLSGNAEQLGTLMNGSHESCARDYEISCPELEALVAIARDAGAIGARLTGAGFGGCTVNLVPVDRLDGFRAAVERRYYREYLRTDGRGESVPPDAIFTARASVAAGYLDK